MHLRIVKYEKINRELSFSFVKAKPEKTAFSQEHENVKGPHDDQEKQARCSMLLFWAAPKKTCSPRCLPTRTKIRYLTNWSAVRQTYKIGLGNKRMKGEVAKKRAFFPQHLVVSPRSQHIQSLAIYFARGRRAISFLLLFEVAKLWNHKFHSRHADE